MNLFLFCSQVPEGKKYLWRVSVDGKSNNSLQIRGKDHQEVKEKDPLEVKKELTDKKDHLIDEIDHPISTKDHQEGVKGPLFSVIDLPIVCVDHH